MYYYIFYDMILYMSNEELFTFVKNFNKSGSIPMETITKGINVLPKCDQELFMLLVNYKNGKDFLNKLNNGEV